MSGARDDPLQPFPATQWSLVDRTRQTDEGRRHKALADFVRRYLPALRSHLMIERRMSPERVDDLLQGFVGHPDQAIEPLARAVSLAPDSARPLINRGWANVALDRLAAAQSDFAAALRVSPADAEALSGLGYVAARKGNAREAQLEASLAMTSGTSANDYRVLHNVACIYAQLSVSDAAQAAMHEEAAMGFLHRAIDHWRRGWGGPHELDLIRREVAFPASMRRRPDFQKLLTDPSAGGLRT